MPVGQEPLLPHITSFSAAALIVGFVVNFRFAIVTFQSYAEMDGTDMPRLAGGPQYEPKYDEVSTPFAHAVPFQ